MKTPYQFRFTFNSRRGVVATRSSSVSPQWMVELSEDLRRGIDRSDVIWLD